jgi:hypothetical protein
MFKFKNNAFHVTRGDSGTISIAYEDGSLLPSSTICFRVYEKDGFDSDPIINIEESLSGNAQFHSLYIDSSQTMKFENPIGDKDEYWYELKLGPDKTVLGYDETGAKIFYVYPTGKDSRG